jgi:hypothetical protein
MRNIILGLVLITGLSFGQSVETYWGLTWGLSSEQVYSVLVDVIKSKNAATKVDYNTNADIPGNAYLVDTLGIKKVYTWFAELDSTTSLVSVDILYHFEYPYDAKSFKDKYLEKYNQSFSSEGETVLTGEGIRSIFRIIREPENGELAPSIFRITFELVDKPKPTPKEIEILF